MTPDEVKTLLDDLFACYPHAPTQGRRRRVVIDAWAPHLKGVDYTDAVAAVDWLVTSNKFLPSLAEVLEACRMTKRDRIASSAIPVVEEDEPPGGYVTLSEWKAQRHEA